MTEPLDGATNMALDEAILQARLREIVPPTLRFFSWDPPTVSLGYGQRLDATINVEVCQPLGVGLVRRPTGGSAIYHDALEREVTYSVVARAGDFEGSADLLETYRWIGAGLTAGLRRLGVPAEMVPATSRMRSQKRVVPLSQCLENRLMRFWKNILLMRGRF